MTSPNQKEAKEPTLRESSKKKTKWRKQRLEVLSRQPEPVDHSQSRTSKKIWIWIELLDCSVATLIATTSVLLIASALKKFGARSQLLLCT